MERSSVNGPPLIAGSMILETRRTAKSMKFEHAAVVDATPEVVFDLTQDYAKRLTWDPFLRRAELLGGAVAPGVGVRAWCVARAGVGMETEYVSFISPRVAAVKMTRGPWLLETFGGTWEFTAVEGGKTRVTFRYQLRARPRSLAWALEPLARWWFSRETRLRVAALEKVLRRARKAPRAGAPGAHDAKGGADK